MTTGKSWNGGGLAWPAVGAAAALLALPAAAPGQGAAEERTLTDGELRQRAPGPLSSVPVPEPPDLERYVRNRKAAVILGKALFWDQNVGSQGMACATCHFQAGADPRSKNQLSPGLNGGNGVFDPTRSGGGGPNYELRPEDFPFHEKVDRTETDETPGNTRYDTDDVSSSAGVRKAEFLGLEWSGEEHCDESEHDPTFHVGPTNTRRVEPRNTPTVINAVFNERNFWDGRASFIFNGQDPFGYRTYEADADAGVHVLDWGCGFPTTRKEEVAIPYASLASQAVGPPLSEFEMSCAGRTFHDIADKLLWQRPLREQRVDRYDGVLGRYRHRSGYGLCVRYGRLIRAAFHPRWWASWWPVRGDGEWAFQIEANFALFFGLAVQLYEATLVSDETPFDAFAAGDDVALTEREKLGLEAFLNPRAGCVFCHGGPELSVATVGHTQGEDGAPIVRNRFFGPRGVFDEGYFNIGVRPTGEDPGIGGTDPYGNPLSYTVQLQNDEVMDRYLEVDPDLLPVEPVENTGVQGAFKAPQLRNVGLTAPYMHNGGMLNLQQVVGFYARGGNFPKTNADDSIPGIGPISVLDGGRFQALVTFLRDALTDPRVQDEQAPFDHPSLRVPHGTVGDSTATSGEEQYVHVPAVGRKGRRASGLPPIELFLEGSGGRGPTASR